MTNDNKQDFEAWLPSPEMQNHSQISIREIQGAANRLYEAACTSNTQPPIIIYSSKMVCNQENWRNTK